MLLILMQSVFVRIVIMQESLSPTKSPLKRTCELKYMFSEDLFYSCFLLNMILQGQVWGSTGQERQ